jgi:hypothetical protein
MGTELSRTLDQQAARRHLSSVLRSARVGAADEAEVLSTAARSRDGDPDSWVSEWVWTAGELWSAAARPGIRTGAATGALYLRAATYYGVALSQLARSAEHGRTAVLWRRQRTCWDRAVEHLGGLRIEIPYLGVSLPGYFFAAPTTAGGRRPLLIMHNGASIPTSTMWGLGGAAARDRGYHWMTFDGPGQQAALRERSLYFRPDWETVLTAVLDAVSDRADVDRGRVASIGVGQAGYLLPRALSREHRLRAAVVAPGVIDVAAAWLDALPGDLREVLHDRGDAAFDRALRAEFLFAPEAERWLRTCAAPYGLAAASPSQIFSSLNRYRASPDMSALRTPLLVVDPGPDTPWPDQSRRLRLQLGASASLVQATADERQERVFSWLEDALGA